MSGRDSGAAAPRGGKMGRDGRTESAREGKGAGGGTACVRMGERQRKGGKGSVNSVFCIRDS